MLETAVIGQSPSNRIGRKAACSKVCLNKGKNDMKTISYLAIALMVSFSMVTSAFAQPQTRRLSPKGMTVKKLPPGMTQLQFQQRIAPVLARLKAESQNQAQQSQREAKAIFDALANERAAINAALNKDPRYKRFVEQAKKITSGPGTSEAKAQQLRALAKANQVIFNDAMRVAKIDRNALQTKIRAVVPSATLAPDFTVRKAALKRTPPSQVFAPKPTTKEIVLRPPFSFEEFEADNGGLAASSADADANADGGRATSKASVLGVAGGADAAASFGELVNVPAGVKRVEFTVTTKTSYNGQALGAVGVGIASVLLGIEVQNEAANQLKNDLQEDTVVAPFAWYAEMEGGRSSDYKFAFDVPAKGGDYLVTGHTFTNAVGGGIPGYAKGESRTEIDKITIKYFYE